MSTDTEGADTETEEEPPDVLNQKKIRLAAAATRAEQAVDEVSAGGGNPATTPASTISGGAWESPDADDFVTDLQGHGTTIRTAFSNAADDLQAEADAEPEYVAHDDYRGRPGPPPNV